MTQSIQVVPFNESDVVALAPIHLTAFKGYMNASMGINYVKGFLNWFIHYPETITLKASFDNQLCGYVVGAPIGYDKYINKDLFQTAMVGILTHPLVLLHENFTRAAKAKLLMIMGKKPVKKVIENPPGKGISLVGICVAPSFNGKGVGKAIMSQFEESARALGMQYMRLSVYRTNTTARNLYEKAGWILLHGQEDIVLYYYKILS